MADLGRLKELFRKHYPSGAIPVNVFRGLLAAFPAATGGTSEESINELLMAHLDDNGLVKSDSFLAWLFGEGLGGAGPHEKALAAGTSPGFALAAVEQKVALEVKDKMCIVTGLVSKQESEALCVSLWLDAGKPPCYGEELDASDRSTWSLNQLEALPLIERLRLMPFTTSHYRCPLKLPLGLAAFKGMVTNMEPISDYLFPVDPMDFLHKKGLIKFQLDKAVFDQGTHLNRRKVLENYRKRFCDHEADFLTLCSSSINGITLREEARKKAAIPLEAKFYSFMYPFVNEPLLHTDAEELGINPADPFICLLQNGGFCYLDHRYEIIAINACCFKVRNNEGFRSCLTLGEPSNVPPLSMTALEDACRWIQVTANAVLEIGFTHFAWVLPSEILGDHIFPMSGGFVYKCPDWKTNLTSSKFFPVVPPGEPWPAGPEPLHSPGGAERVKAISARLAERPTRLAPTPHTMPLTIRELGKLSKRHSEAPVDEAIAKRGDKYVVSEVIWEDPTTAAVGLKGLLEKSLKDKPVVSVPLDGAGQLQLIREEIGAAVAAGLRWATDADLENVTYVLDQPASEVEVMGNDGHTTVRDKGHDGKTLADFHQMPPSTMSSLTLGEVAALRLYTTSTFRLINDPLREYAKLKAQQNIEIPLPATTQLLTSALKKMRSLYLNSTEKFDEKVLWRGLRNCVVDDHFEISGGCEPACLSTSTDLSTVAKYSESQAPLLFRIQVSSPMEMGADISWLSVFPGEQEVLYPPLTYMKPIHKQGIRGVPNGIVITVQPAFSG